MMLTEPARAILLNSDAEAKKLGDNILGTEHLLLAIAKHEAPDEGMKDALYWTTQALWVNPTKVLARIGKHRHPVPDPAVQEPLPFSPNLRMVLDYAEDEARSMGHPDDVESEHLLLGIVRNQACRAAGILKSMGISPADVREAIVYFLEKMDRIPAKIIERHEKGIQG